MRYNRGGRGRLAQLGERHVRNVEVVGSIPTPSTNFHPALLHITAFRMVGSIQRTGKVGRCSLTLPILGLSRFCDALQAAPKLGE